MGADARQIGFLVAFDFPKLLLVLAILLVAKSNGHIFRSLDEVKSAVGKGAGASSFTRMSPSTASAGKADLVR